MSSVGFEANCQTTAMGILPHTDIERAVDLALSLNIPFWPQLPKVSYFEDMYVQALDHFPGVRIDFLERKILFDLGRFYEELPAYFEKAEDPETFRLTKTFSLVYHRFLERDLSGYTAIRGQMISPISLGLKVVDQDQKPIIYHDEVREVLFDFIQKKVNLQNQELKTKNPRAFVWLDDPGLGLIFTALSGYNEVQGREDLDRLLEGLEGPKGIHLCARPDWDFLLHSKIDILSFDSFSCGAMITQYSSLKDFFNREGVISWGIVPTYTELLEEATVESLTEQLETFWEDLVRKGVKKEKVIRQSLLAPATCNLLSPDKEKTVERAFDVLKELSAKVREKYGLN
ncbi:MAG: hypothetical protein A2156_04655 [Deltaproteobacteria bacterium RBG_16_48_10]|nr:MAG: hypothetical protein A2156_04655 [Deltaproteobacteria bacterium RBG_16_48_10]